jgi:hypothetical protein
MFDQNVSETHGAKNIAQEGGRKAFLGKARRISSRAPSGTTAMCRSSLRRAGAIRSRALRAWW